MSLAALGAKSKPYLFGAAVLSSLAEPADAMQFVSLDELAPLARRYRRPELFIAGNALAALVYLGLDRPVAA